VPTRREPDILFHSLHGCKSYANPITKTNYNPNPNTNPNSTHRTNSTNPPINPTNPITVTAKR